MKTSVEIDEKKILLAKKLSHVSTLRDLLDKALDAYIALERRHAMADLLGLGLVKLNKKQRANRVRPGR